MRVRWQRRFDRWVLEALICAELVALVNVAVLAGVVYALEYIAARLEHRVSGRPVRH